MLEEKVRRVLAEVSNGRKKLADMENLHEKNYSDLKNLRGDNEYREQENQQLEKDMGTLEEHLVMMEK